MTDHGGQRMSVTVTWEYEAHAGNYDGETDPAVWAQVDADNMQEDAGIIADMAEHYDYKVTVVPV